MYPKLRELKELIKTRAAGIRAEKNSVKNAARNGDTVGAATYQSSVYAEKLFIRHRHIAYCLLRGTEYERIEKPREGNEPNWKLIDQLRQEYAHEDVCVGA